MRRIISLFAILMIGPGIIATSAGVRKAFLTAHEWVWQDTSDATGEIYAPDSTTAGHTLRFKADDTFQEDYPGGCCGYHGTWVLGGERLVLKYKDEKRKGQSVTYRIVGLTDKRLILEARGRHGTLTERYVRKEPEKGPAPEKTSPDEE